MALGNSSSMGQARGKNKGTVARRSREHHNAANFTAFNCGAIQANSSASCSNGDATSKTFYHDGGAALPDVNDVVYSIKRAYSPNSFPAGFYKISSSGRAASLQINSVGLVTSKTTC